MSNNYYYDLEFLEGTQTKSFLGFKYKTPPTIDIISIGIVSEDNREYYAISKDFNLKEAWNRYDLKRAMCIEGMTHNKIEKVYWIRENVLSPIFKDLWEKGKNAKLSPVDKHLFTYKNLKKLIFLYGKSNKQISEEVKDFCTTKLITEKVIDRNFYCTEESYTDAKQRLERGKSVKLTEHFTGKSSPVNLYGYYSAYDHVAFCWLFGKMIDLPSGFPMYTIDLQQEKDRIIQRAYNRAKNDFERKIILDMESMKDYPKQTNEHSAIHDARFNKQLHEFLKTL